MRFNSGYTRKYNNMKVRFLNVLYAKQARKVLGKNEEHPIYNLDMKVTKEQCQLLDDHYIRFDIIE